MVLVLSVTKVNNHIEKTILDVFTLIFYLFGEIIANTAVSANALLCGGCGVIGPAPI